MVLIFNGWFGENDHIDTNRPRDNGGYRFFISDNLEWNDNELSGPGSGNACLARGDSAYTVLASTLGTENRPGYALCLNTQTGDNCAVGGNPPDIRADITHTLQYLDNPEVWYSISVYVPQGWSQMPNVWGTSLSQWFDTIYMTGGKDPDSFQILARTYNFFRHVTGQIDGIEPEIIKDSAPGSLTAGWHDFLFHYKWSTQPDGFVHFYMDKQLIGSVTNRRTVPQNTKGKHEWDIIMYEGSPQNYHELYFYNVKAGTTRADVEYIGNNNQCPPLVCNMRVT